jgi:hypothetical protein
MKRLIFCLEFFYISKYIDVAVQTKGSIRNQEPKHPPPKNMICFLFATLPRCLSHVCIAAASTIEHAPMLCVLSCQFNGQGNLTKRYVLEYACALFLEMDVVLYFGPNAKSVTPPILVLYHIMLEVRIMMNKLNVIFKTYSYVKYD